MTWFNNDFTVTEGFTFVDKQSGSASNNHIANSIKSFGFGVPTGSKKPSKLAKLKKKRSKLTDLDDNSDKFQDVLNEVDSIDLEAFSIKGIADTIKKYNTNLDNRLQQATKKNNAGSMDKAMAQWDVLKDEFGKIFSFSEFI